jgi:hypothetical protein
LAIDRLRAFLRHHHRVALHTNVFIYQNDPIFERVEAFETLVLDQTL